MILFIKQQIINSELKFDLFMELSKLRSLISNKGNDIGS